MDQVEWEARVKSWMLEGGWEMDYDNETTLGFSFKEGDYHWMRDYNKKSRRFVQFDGNQRVNIVSKKDE